MTTTYGIVGCGMMGREHIRNIAFMDDATVGAILEPNPEMGAAALALAPGAVIVDSLDALLAHRPLDCLLIASPNHCHAGQLAEIAAKATLPILVEKPLFTDLADLAMVESFRKDYGAPVWVAMEYRYMPPMQKFLEMADDVTGGIRMLSIVEHRYPFLEKIGNWVMASAGQEVNHLNEVYDGRTADIWDSGYVIVDFASGARGMLELSMFAEGSEYQEMVHAVGAQGKLEVKIPGPARFWSGPEAARPFPLLVESRRHPCNPVVHQVPIDAAILDAGDHNGSTFYQHQRFLDVVRGRGSVEVSLEDGIWAVRMGQAAQQSAATGKAVTF